MSPGLSSPDPSGPGPSTTGHSGGDPSSTDPVIEVRGGVGGTTVGVDELVGAAGQLVQAAADLGGVVVGLVAAAARVAASSSTGAALSPLTAVRAEAEVLEAARALVVEAAALEGVALAVRAAARAYGEVEDEVVRTASLAQDVVLALAGHAAPTLVVGVVALEAVGVDVADLLDRAAWALPEVAELGGGSGGLVVGLRSNPLTAPLLAPPLLAPPHRVSSSPWARPDLARPADRDEQAVGVLADSAAARGLLDDAGAVRVTEAAVPGGGGRATVGPVGVAALAGDLAELPGDGRVRVVEVAGDRGPAWIVEIGGTQVWDARAGENPFDLTTDVRSMAGESTLLAAGVQQALATAQAGAAAAGGRDVAAEPVMLAGHSLGGIVAAGLASSAEFRSAHRVTHVVALGSPIGKAPVPPGVQVLALEHRQDPVPRLEGRANPDRVDWVTVSRDLADDPGQRHRASAAHPGELYVGTGAAVDASDDRSVVRWREGASSFFESSGGPGTAVVRDYRIARVGPEP
ncbi:PGAP1-like alpha/beta domain-containing protein [Pedococcus soli]